jgi:acetylglutamate kinase
MTEENLKAAVMGDVALLHYVGIHPVVVHGGGREISDMCRQLGIEPQFVQGMRVTDPETMRVTEMVMGKSERTSRSCCTKKARRLLG